MPVEIILSTPKVSVIVDTPLTEIEIGDVIVGGGGDKNYIHNQIGASSLWIVTHNLNKRCSVSIVDSGDSMVIGDVNYLNNNSLTITFSAAFSGKAYCN